MPEEIHVEISLGVFDETPREVSIGNSGSLSQESSSRGMNVWGVFNFFDSCKNFHLKQKKFSIEFLSEFSPKFLEGFPKETTSESL